MSRAGDELDMDAAGAQVLRLARARREVPAGMEELIAWCARHRPHRSWPALRRINWAADVKRLERWLTGVLRDQPPPATIDGLYFGLFNPTSDEGAPSADLYVAGNPYDAEDPDWICDPAWWPAARYAGSKALARLYRVAYADGASGLGNDAEYPLGLGYAVLAVGHLCRTLGETLLSGGAQRRAVATGFDSGDVLQLGALDRRTPGLKGQPRWC